MKSRLKILILGIFVTVTCSGSAWAETYKVTVKNTDTKQSDISVFLCDGVELCLFEVPGTGQNKINVAMRFESENVYIQFMRNGHYLATTSVGNKTLDVPLKEFSKGHAVKLYRLHPAAEGDQQDHFRSSPVLRILNDVVTELEISVNQSL